MAGKFKTAEWVQIANVYEVNLRQYTPEGTFTAFQQHLPRLRKMGIDVLWFMPITPVSRLNRQGALGSYYACSSYETINPEFGNIEDFKKTVEIAHSMGFKVIIDWVANHTGWDHEWTMQHPDFYKKNSEGNFYDANGWTDVIDLDFSNRHLWSAMTDAMTYWVKECGINGFRCDMAHLVPLEFWFFARTELDKQKQLFWMAETETIAYHEVFDATYAWEFLHCMEAVYRGESSLQNLKDVLNKYEYDFPKNALRLFFTSNHDENSHSGSEYERMGDGAKAFAILCATYKNSLPLIYSGQELPNKKRLKFFDKDNIDWTGQCFLANFYKTMLLARKNNSALRAGDSDVNTVLITTNAPQSILAYHRTHNQDELLVLLNLSGSPVKFSIADNTISGTYTSLFSGLDYQLESSASFKMERWEYLVYTKVKKDQL